MRRNRLYPVTHSLLAFIKPTACYTSIQFLFCYKTNTSTSPNEKQTAQKSLERDNFASISTMIKGREEDAKFCRRKRKRAWRGRRVCCVVPEHGVLSCTTFNILAPIYKRLDHENTRESDYRAYWLSRNQRILDQLLADCSSIICLQEVWLGNEELVNLYEKRLGDANYDIFKLARTNNRGDGLLAAVSKGNFKVINYKELLFNDFGDRVAQLLHVESIIPFSQTGNGDENIQQEILIVNTHLLFPHDRTFCIVRLKQVYKILQYIEAYQKENKLGPMPIILSGDWNGSKRGQVYQFLRSQGFVSSYDQAHHYTDNDADCHKWVSHRNHRGNICGVDFIWLLNPSMQKKTLKTSWNQAVLAIIKNLLRAASLSEYNAFELLKADNSCDYITYSSFCQAMYQLNLLHPNGLESEEIDELWAHADLDRNGVLDFQEFMTSIWNTEWRNQFEKTCEEETILEQEHLSNNEVVYGFTVKDAVLFPPEVETGIWPDNYNLSDHAPLTVTFSPVKIFT
ncbi:Calcium-binding endonuclease/exonuclease/phosphatase family [Rhynchospora pubera]|uniref:Calcium-binding endonuclease/exonuclease/phosphatase family n=2 Tax=Rhynchospora pubera TaxID=906938 RepID=A0AAV8GNH9_9POAL|nr:Calcium-binding endonuclease/exonuclease/phosphatase family [Rhynchospora pubera]